MKSTHLLAGLLALASVFLDLVVASRFQSSSSTPLMLFLGLALGQLALLAFWCAAARHDWLLRLAVLLAAVTFLGRPLSRLTVATWSQWSFLLFLFAVCVAALLLLARWLGVTPFAVLRDREPQPRKHPRFPARYSLSSLLSIMSLVAIVLGLSRHVTLPAQHIPALTSYGFWVTLTAITALWALHSRQALSVRVALLSALCIVAGLSMARTESQQTVWFFTMIALIEAMTVCGGIAVLETTRILPCRAVERKARIQKSCRSM